MGTIILSKQNGRTLRLYAAGAVLLQGTLLAGCDRPADRPDPAPGDRGGAANGSATATAPSRATEATRVPAPSGPQRLILAFGDSLYAGYGLGRGQSLPDAVQARLRRDGINATVMNAGVSGDTTAAGRQRFAFALDNLPRKPDLVLIGLGGNDVLRQIQPAETRANMTAMMEELKRRDIPAMLTGMMAPPNLGAEYASAFNGIWPDLASRYKAALYPFILNGVIGDPRLMQADRVHPNRVGVDRIADRVTPMVEARLNELD